MAMINRIRKRSGLLIIVIGGAMAAFVLGDLFRGGGRYGQVQENAAGKIYGEKIPNRVYSDRVQEEIDLQRDQAGELDSETRQEIRDQVWEEMIRDRIFRKHLQELGITVPPEELEDLLAGDNVHPQIRRLFQQQTGEFNREMVLQRIAQTYRNNEQARRQWTRITDGIIKERGRTKFSDLINKAMYVNNIEAQDHWEAQNRSADIRFLLRPYASLPDEDVEVSEEEVREYYEEHKDDKEYEQESYRSFEYVLIDASPSKKDVHKAREEAEELKERFRKAENDSLFAANQTDRRERFVEFFRKGELEDPEQDSLLFESEPGDVTGPFRQEERFSLLKLMNFEERPDSVMASHILIGRQQPNKEDSLREVAQGLKERIQEGEDFAELARKNSEDPGSAQDGGSVGWVQPGEMLPPFDSAVFHSDSGAMPIVKTRAGVHLIRVEKKTKPVKQARTAIIDREIRPSKETVDSAYDKASKLAIQSEGPESFQKLVEEEGYRKRLATRVKESDHRVARLEDSRRLVKWAYNAKEGEVSSAIRCGDRYVVGLLTEAREKGVPSFEVVQEDMKEERIKEKKAEHFIEEMKGSRDLDSLASALDLEIRSADALSFNSSSLPGGGNEPYVIGKVLQVDEGYLTKPIEGNSGVYIASVESVVEAGEPGQMDLTRIRQQLQRDRELRVNQELVEILKEHADVEDERHSLR